MPSMHVGWSLWSVYAVWSALRAAHPRAALLSWVFPLVMTAVVLTTGNHYVLDVVGSGVLLVVSIGAVSIWSFIAAIGRSRRAWSAGTAGTRQGCRASHRQLPG
jgi:hypothetical protein